MNQKERSKFIKKCDVLFSLIIRVLGYCEWCGRSDIQLNNHHVIGRVVMILRFDKRNCCCLCVNCHEFSKESVKNNPIKFLDWFKATRPEDYDYIKAKSREVAHYTIYQLQEIYQSLKEEYKRLEVI